MSGIAVQGAIGDIGAKATTKLSSSYNSLATINGVAIGANSSGLHLLNSGNQNNDVDFTKTFTLATTDFGIDNFKRIRFVYIGIDFSSAITLSVKADDQSWRNYTITPKKTGLQKIKKSIGRNGQGRYWTFKISSISAFRIDSLKAAIYVRPIGISGY